MPNMKHEESSLLWGQSKQLGHSPLWLLRLLPGRLVQNRGISEMEILQWLSVPGRVFISSLLFAVFWESLWHYPPDCWFLFSMWPWFPLKHTTGWALKSVLVMLSLKFSLWFPIHWAAKVRKKGVVPVWVGSRAGKMGRHQGVLGPSSCPGSAGMIAMLVPSLLTRYEPSASMSWTVSKAMLSHGPCP